MGNNNKDFKDEAHPIYTIKQASQMAHLSKPTIRYYEEIGLISNIFRDKNNIRFFSDNDIRRLKIIQCMRNTGIGIELIRHYFDLANEDVVELKERYSIVLQQEEILLRKMKELEQQLASVQRAKLDYEEELRKR
jgi:Predicted transcriptional regulators